MSKSEQLVLIVFFCWTGFFALSYENIGMVQTDQVEYLEAAGQLSSYASRFHGVGFPAAIWAVSSLGISSFTAGKLISLLCATGVVALTMRLAHSLSMPQNAAIPGALVAASPGLIDGAYLVYADALAALGYVGALAILIREGGAASMRAWAAIGGLMGVAVVTRYVYLPVPILFIGYLVWMRGFGIADRLRWALAFTAGLCVVAGPWAYLTASRSGVPFDNANYANLAIVVLNGGVPDYAKLLRYADEYGSFADVITRHPTGYVRHVARNLRELWTTGTVQQLYLAGFLTVPGLLMSLWRGDPRVVFLASATLVLTGLTAHAWITPRYLIPILPAFAIFAAYALSSDLVPERLAAQAGGRWRDFPLRRAVLGLVLSVSVACVATQTVLSFRAHDRPGLRAAGEQLREDGASGAVASSSPVIAYYAHLDHVPLGAVRDDSFCRATCSSSARVTSRSSSAIPRVTRAC